MRTVPKDLHIHIRKYDCKKEIGEVCLKIRIKDDTGHETVVERSVMTVQVTDGSCMITKLFEKCQNSGFMKNYLMHINLLFQWKIW